MNLNDRASNIISVAIVLIAVILRFTLFGAAHSGDTPQSTTITEVARTTDHASFTSSSAKRSTSSSEKAKTTQEDESKVGPGETGIEEYKTLTAAKSYFRNTLGSPTGESFVLRGDNVLIIKRNDNFYYASYTNPQKVDTKGWLPVSDFEGTSVNTSVQPVNTPSEPESGGRIFSVVEQMPQYPGGEEALMSFIHSNIRYPAAEKQYKVEGRVVVGMVVNEDGSVGNVSVKKGVSPGLDNEAARIVKMLPRFSPGRSGGVAVKVSYVIPIMFKI